MSFAIAYLSEDDLLTIHTLAGYTISALILVRLLWGVVGSRHARFVNFVCSPAKVKEYLGEVVRLRPRRYLGHNPAGSVMVIALLSALTLTLLSGFLIYGGKEMAGPFAGVISGTSTVWLEIVEGLHELLANTTLLLVVIHVFGVVVSSLLHGENLIRAMVSGKKVRDQQGTMR